MMDALVEEEQAASRQWTEVDQTRFRSCCPLFLSRLLTRPDGGNGRHCGGVLHIRLPKLHPNSPAIPRVRRPKLCPSPLLLAAMAEVQALFNNIGVAVRNHNAASLAQVLTLHLALPLAPHTQNEVLSIKAVDNPTPSALACPPSKCICWRELMADSPGKDFPGNGDGSPTLPPIQRHRKQRNRRAMGLCR